MAEKKRSSTGSKSSGKAKSSGSRASAASRNNQKSLERKPIRREVWAFVCLFLAAFTLLGLFRINAVFITLTMNLIRGLVGAGVYVMPFALLLDACNHLKKC